jgi:PKD repeat protein
MMRTRGALAAVAAVLTAVVVPSTALAVGANQPTVVNTVPASYTPNVNDGVVYAIGQVGSTVFIGGSFSSVSPHGSSTTFADNEIAAFTAGTGALVNTFQPTISGGTVEAISPGPTAGTVYVAGSFASIDGVATSLALLNTSTGAMAAGWTSPSLTGEVTDVQASNGQLFVAGEFSVVNGFARHGFATLNPASGALTSYSTLNFLGHHNFGRLCIPSATVVCASGGVGVRTFDISPDGTRLIAIGNFTTANGSARDQIALIDLGATSATVDANWATAQYSAPCASQNFDTYPHDVQFSPDGSYFVVVSTGGRGGTNSDGTMASCDSAKRFETNGTGTDVQPTWSAYDGRDSLWTVAITGSAIYVGGHERWFNNTLGNNFAAEGATIRPGIAALDPINGLPMKWNPGRNPRGQGAYALLATNDGLYIGSDQDWIGNFTYHLKKIAFWPLAGGETLPSNSVGSLPGNVYLLGSGTSSSTAQQVQWDGSSLPSTPNLLSAVDWSTARGAFAVNGNVYYGSTDGNFYERSFDGTTFGPAVAIDPYDDPLWDNVLDGTGGVYQGVKSNFYSELSSLTSMFYSAGRVYYTLSGRSQMFWRWFEPDDGVMGADEFTTTDGLNWGHVSGAFLSGSTLYFADSASQHLFSVAFTGGQAAGTPTVADSSFNWTSHGAFVVSGAPVVGPTAAFSATCVLLTCSFDASASTDTLGPITGYSWTWGDGQSSQDTTPTDTHVFASDGTYPVTLTVTDGGGNTSSQTRGLTVSSGAPPSITFQGVSTYDGNASTAAVGVPAVSTAGDALLLFESYASSTITASTPAGWTLVGTTKASNLTTSVYSRTAQVGDAGSNVGVTFSGQIKASLTLADYAHAAIPVESQASAIDANTATHTSPTVTGLTTGSLVVTCWMDKATGTTAWTPPGAVVGRSQVFGTGGGAVSAMLADSGVTVSGSYGHQAATTNVTSGSGVTWTVALATD